MSLQDVIHLSRLSGTSSNGALPTSYENLWEDPGHKESDISPEISKPSNDDTTTGFYGLSIWIKSPSDVDMWVSTPPSSGKSSGFIVLKWNISPISQHEEPQLSYTLTTDQQKMVDQSTWWNVDRILQQRDFTTAYIKWHRLYTSQQSLQDSQKRKISERFAVLAQREDDWDERGSKKPNQLILVHAERLINRIA